MKTKPRSIVIEDLNVRGMMKNKYFQLIVSALINHSQDTTNMQGALYPNLRFWSVISNQSSMNSNGTVKVKQDTVNEEINRIYRFLQIFGNGEIKLASDRKENYVLQRVKQLLEVEKKQSDENFKKHFNKAESEYERLHLLKGYSKKML